MSVGLMALLDDVAGLAKVAAASLDDVIGQAAKAGAKAAGVVIDDAAVTPRYVVGFTADRELPIIGRIARGSLRNKLVFLLPIALLLAFFAAWAITPLLMIGGAYLAYEGAEKVYEALVPHAAHAHEAKLVPARSTRGRSRSRRSRARSRPTSSSRPRSWRSPSPPSRSAASGPAPSCWPPSASDHRRRLRRRRADREGRRHRRGDGAQRRPLAARPPVARLRRRARCASCRCSCGCSRSSAPRR